MGASSTIIKQKSFVDFQSSVCYLFIYFFGWPDLARLVLLSLFGSKGSLCLFQKKK
jgi:hypothetical protein